MIWRYINVSLLRYIKDFVHKIENRQWSIYFVNFSLYNICYIINSPYVYKRSCKRKNWKRVFNPVVWWMGFERNWVKFSHRNNVNLLGENRTNFMRIKQRRVFYNKIISMWLSYNNYESFEEMSCFLWVHILNVVGSLQNIILILIVEHIYQLLWWFALNLGVYS